MGTNRTTGAHFLPCTNAEWKGRELWVTSGNRTPFDIEGIDAPAPGAPGCDTRDAVEPARRRIPAPPRPARALNGLDCSVNS